MQLCSVDSSAGSLTIGRLNIVDIVTTTDHFVNLRVPLVLYLSSSLGMATSENSLTNWDDDGRHWSMMVQLLLTEASLGFEFVLGLLVSIAQTVLM